MNNENETAAPAAVESAAPAADVETNMVVHPTNPPNPPEPVPDPPHDPSNEVSSAELEQLRSDALQDDIDPAALEQVEMPVNIIPPSIGRKVWFRPGGSDIDNGQAEDATIVYVHSDHMVNLFVVDHNGNPRAETSIPLVHEGEVRPVSGHFAEWMPFQKGQARAQNGGIPISRVVTVGDDVYYGDGRGGAHSAKVTNINDLASVDLVVFERERVHHVFGVAKADLNGDFLDGWVHKA